MGGILFKFLNPNWASFELWYEQLIKLKKNITNCFSLELCCEEEYRLIFLLYGNVLEFVM